MRRTLYVAGENSLLELLPAKERDRLAEYLDPIPLPMKQELAQRGKRMTHVYFPLGGVVSQVIDVVDGGRIEVGAIGNEGMVGTSVLLGGEVSSTHAFVQIPGSALRMKASDFLEQVGRAPALGMLVRRYAEAQFGQLAQTIACNHAHSIEQRMCRWLLMCHDRVGADEFPLTQEFLAQMLGVRRPSVTVVAGTLQREGLIRYGRGRMQIADRRAVEQSACDCYEIVNQEFERLLTAWPETGT